jgi:hypothetical protein
MSLVERLFLEKRGEITYIPAGTEKKIKKNTALLVSRRKFVNLDTVTCPLINFCGVLNEL